MAGNMLPRALSNEEKARLYIMRAWAELGEDDPDRAIADFNEAIRLLPEYPKWYADRGRTVRHEAQNSTRRSPTRTKRFE